MLQCNCFFRRSEDIGEDELDAHRTGYLTRKDWSILRPALENQISCPIGMYVIVNSEFFYINSLDSFSS